MALSKTTIFRQLIFNIALPTLVALLVFAGINFQRTRSILVSDRFAVEHKTQRPKKYTYQTTRDGKYIIEIGAYSKQVDEIVQAIEDTKNELKSETEGIVDV